TPPRSTRPLGSTCSASRTVKSQSIGILLSGNDPRRSEGLEPSVSRSYGAHALSVPLPRPAYWKMAPGAVSGRVARDFRALCRVGNYRAARGSPRSGWGTLHALPSHKAAVDYEHRSRPESRPGRAPPGTAVPSTIRHLLRSSAALRTDAGCGEAL